MSHLVYITNALLQRKRLVEDRICRCEVEEELRALFEGSPFNPEDVRAVGHRIHALAPQLLASDFCTWLGYAPHEQCLVEAVVLEEAAA